MHPHTFFSTLFHFDKREEVFVIMSFAPEFNRRWERVIEPAISQELRLRPNRVDDNDSGESVVHDIMDGIAHSRVVLADISSSTMSDRRGQTWPQRNGNVMWELGIAHVMRLPDEVIVVRSDDDPSIFDLTQFRAFQYDPEGDEEEARRILVSLVRDRMRSIDQSRSDYVRRCAGALDPGGIGFLFNAAPLSRAPFPIEATMGNALIYPRLFELGILKSSISSQRPEGWGPPKLVTYATVTPLGYEVIRVLSAQLGLPSPFDDPTATPPEDPGATTVTII